MQIQLNATKFGLKISLTHLPATTIVHVYVIPFFSKYNKGLQNYLLKLEDGITLIEITEFVHTVIKMNSVMNFTIF